LTENGRFDNLPRALCELTGLDHGVKVSLTLDVNQGLRVVRIKAGNGCIQCDGVSLLLRAGPDPNTISSFDLHLASRSVLVSTQSVSSAIVRMILQPGRAIFATERAYLQDTEEKSSGQLPRASTNQVGATIDGFYRIYS
jgi:hypothetical protein